MEECRPQKGIETSQEDQQKQETWTLGVQQTKVIQQLELDFPSYGHFGHHVSPKKLEWEISQKQLHIYAMFFYLGFLIWTE